MAANLLERAKKEGTPLIDGSTATFVWEGEHAPHLIADFNEWEEQGGTELQSAGAGAWSISFDFPQDAYVEYAFLDGEKRYADPYNRRKVNNGVGSYNNFFYMPGTQPTPLARVKQGVPRGKAFSEILSADPFVVGGKRRVHFYQPPIDAPCPLVIVWDGRDYLKRAHLTKMIDNLIHAGRIQPIALAMPENGGQARMMEYGCSEITLGFIDNYLLRRARECLNLIDIKESPGAFGVMGASMGGLMALFTGLRMPGIFGKILSQSGAFSIPVHEFLVWDLVRSQDPAGQKIWMDCGTMEWLTDTNRKMVSLLKTRGYQVAYQEYRGGHNYTAWRNDLMTGLEYLFRKP